MKVSGLQDRFAQHTNDGARFKNEQRNNGPQQQLSNTSTIDDRSTSVHRNFPVAGQDTIIGPNSLHIYESIRTEVSGVSCQIWSEGMTEMTLWTRYEDSFEHGFHVLPTTVPLKTDEIRGIDSLHKFSGIVDCRKMKVTLTIVENPTVRLNTSTCKRYASLTHELSEQVVYSPSYKQSEVSEQPGIAATGVFIARTVAETSDNRIPFSPKRTSWATRHRQDTRP